MKNIKYWKVVLSILILSALLLLTVSLVYDVGFVFRQPHGDNPLPMGVLKLIRIWRLK